jgi:hypothetical protein
MVLPRPIFRITLTSETRRVRCGLDPRHFSLSGGDSRYRSLHHHIKD